MKAVEELVSSLDAGACVDEWCASTSISVPSYLVHTLCKATLDGQSRSWSQEFGRRQPA